LFVKIKVQWIGTKTTDEHVDSSRLGRVSSRFVGRRFHVESLYYWYIKLLDLSKGFFLAFFYWFSINLSNYKFSFQAFALDGNSMLSRIPRKNLKKLSELGFYKAAFDLKRHPAFTGILFYFYVRLYYHLKFYQLLFLIPYLFFYYVGISRQWLRSKSDNANFSKLFEEIDADSVSSLVVSY
jgi:hypothetical protein